MTRMIDSPAEIPVPGAPYDQIVPDMFKDGDFYKTIIDKYYYRIPQKAAMPSSTRTSSHLSGTKQRNSAYFTIRIPNNQSPV